MNLKNKGFTLVELLAVIILIGLIAVIVLPKIQKSLENSKKEIAQTSALSYSKQIDKLIIEEKLKNNSIKLDGDYNIDSTGKIYNEEDEYILEFTGEKPTSGKLIFIENELQSACIVVNNYAVIIEDGEATNALKGNCDNQSIGESIITIAQNYANNVKAKKGNVTNIFDVPVDEISNNKVKDGWVAIVNGEINSYSLKIGEYIVTLSNGNTTISKTTEIAKKTTADARALATYLGGENHAGIIYLTDAIEIYYNPISGNLCNSSDSVSTTGTITGCMRWYLYSIHDDYANMLLDHNITEAKSNAGAWALKDDYAAGLTPIMDGETITGYQITEGEGSKAITAGVTYPGVSSFDSYEPFGSNERGPLTALNTLKSLTSGWNGTQTPRIPNGYPNKYINYIIPYQIDYTGYKARLITKEEAEDLGCDTPPNAYTNTCPEWMMKGTVEEDYTTYANINGYWTSSAGVRGYATGRNMQNISVDSTNNGVRPVITVNVNDVL